MPIDKSKLEKIQENANNLLICSGDACRMTYKVEIRVQEPNTVIVELVVSGSHADCRYSLADHGPVSLKLVLDDTAIMTTMQVGTWLEGRKCECISRIKLGYFLIMIAMEIAKEHGCKEIEFDDMSAIKGYYENCGATRLEEGLPEMVFDNLSNKFINALFKQIRDNPGKRLASGIKYNVNIDSVFSTINMKTLINTLLIAKKWKNVYGGAGGGGAGGGAAASVKTGNPAKKARLDNSANGGRRLTKRRRKNKKKKKRKTRRKRTRKKN